MSLRQDFKKAKEIQKLNETVKKRLATVDRQYYLNESIKNIKSLIDRKEITLSLLITQREKIKSKEREVQSQISSLLFKIRDLELDLNIEK